MRFRVKMGFLVIISMLISTGVLQSNTDIVQMIASSSLSTESKIIMGTTDSIVESIDPAQSYDFFGWEIINHVGGRLVDIAPGSEAGINDIQASLAESWSVDASGLEWTFHLRQGVYFEDGIRFNASVVKYSFDRNIGLALPEGPQLNIGYSDIIDETIVISEYVIQFNLKTPFTPFLQLLSSAPSSIVHPDYAPLDHYVPYNASAPVRENNPNGLGPYLLETWNRIGATDVEMILVKNPYYWDPAIPLNDKIVINFYPTETALTAALVNNEVDFAYRHMTATQINQFRDNLYYKVWDGVGAFIQYLCFNQEFYPLNETPIRQGIAAALNRSYLASSVFSDSVNPLYSMIPAGLEFHRPSFMIYGESNYTFTQTALALHGYNESNKLQIDLYYESSGHYPSSEQQAQVIKYDLEASGVIRVYLHGVDWTTFRLNRNEGTMSIFFYGWYPDYIHADNYAFLPFASWLNMGYNSTYPAGGVAQYSLWTDGRTSLTPQDQQNAYYSLQDLQAEECSAIPLWQSRISVVSTAKISGITLDITNMLHMWLYSKMQASTTSSSTATSTTSCSCTSTTTTTSSTTTSSSGTTAGWEYWGFVSIIMTVGSICVIFVGVIFILKARRHK